MTRPMPSMKAPAGRLQPPLNNPATQVETDSMRRFAFYSAIAMVFMRFSVLPELLTTV